MSDSQMYAAIWPLKATKKSDYQIVSTAWIKNFKEAKNHGQTLFKFKPPGAKQSSLVFILVTGTSEEDVKASLLTGRIRYPSKNLIEPNRKVTTSEEEKTETVAQQSRTLKNQGKISTMQSIVQSHISKTRAPVKIAVGKGGKSVPGAKKSMKQCGKKSIDSVATKSSVLGQSSSSKASGTTSIQASVAKPTQPLTEKIPNAETNDGRTYNSHAAVMNTASQTDDIFTNRLISLEAKVTKQEEDINVLDAKLQSYEDQTQKQINLFTEKLAILEKRSTEKSAGNTVAVHQKSNLPSSSKGPFFHLNSTNVVPLGHGVEADGDVWSTIEDVISKDDWALAALLSVFGAESKYYRARKPRLEDPKLRVFPDQPPVIFVLRHFYRKWLRGHPNVLDQECLKDELPEDSPYDDWPTLFEHEEAAEREKRRKCKVASLIKKLPALMADKAINMYRQGHRSDGDVEWYEEDNASVNDDSDEVSVELLSNDEDFTTSTPKRVKPELQSDDGSSSDLSPESRQFFDSRQL